MFGTLPHMTTLVGVALRGWSGQMCDLSHLFLFFLFLHSSARAHVTFLERSGRSIRQNACFRPWMCPLGVATTSDYIEGVKSPKTSPKWAGIGTLQPNQRNSKIAIYRSMLKIFTSNFTDSLNTGAIFEKNAKLGQIGCKGVN